MNFLKLILIHKDNKISNNHKISNNNKISNSHKIRNHLRNFQEFHIRKDQDHMADNMEENMVVNMLGDNLEDNMVHNLERHMLEVIKIHLGTNKINKVTLANSIKMEKQDIINMSKTQKKRL